MTRALRWYDYITINIYFLGLTTLAQTLGLIFPLLVQQFVGETGQGAFFGNLRLWTLMVALLVQAGMGMFSDHSTFRWGRRRPFILGGTLLDMVFLVAIGFAFGLEGMRGYWFLLAMAILVQVSSNSAQSAQQGLIPDIVPDEMRGRFSGVKALFEIPLPLLIVSFTIARLVSAGNMWEAILLTMGILIFVMLLTMLVPEMPLEIAPEEVDWAPFMRLVLMTALFTIIILGSGQLVRIAGQVLTDSESPVMMFIIM
jgi:MFS family permease